jgi:leucyl-tRNA synthetase
VYRFLGRVWRLFVDEESDRQYQDEVTAGTRRPDNLSCLKVASSIQNIAPSAEQLKLLHATIKKVTQDLDAMAFNVGIAHMMEYVNETMKIAQSGQSLAKPVLEQFVLVLSPFAPHLSEELWRMLGHNSTLAYEPWPKWDEKHLVEDTVEIVVQVNGRVRDRVSVPAAADNDGVKAQALASEKVKTAMAGKQPKKVIVIPKKLVNVVVE